MSGPVRTSDHRVRLDDGRMATARATISWPYWREPDVRIEGVLADDGATVAAAALRPGARRRLIRGVLRAAMVAAAFGGTTCRHGRFLVEEFCAPCLGEGRASA